MPMSFIEEKLREIQAEVDNTNGEKLLILGTRSFYFIAAAAFVALLTYVLKFGTSLSSDRDEWGVFGDYLGGVLNPLVGIVTVLLVLINVRLQRQELKNSLQEMRSSNNALKEQTAALEIQGFQSTFFSWLNSYNNIVSNFEVIGGLGGPPHRGHAALSFIKRFELNTDAYYHDLLDFTKAGDRERFRNGDELEDESATQNVEISILKRWREKRNAREDFFEGGFRSLINIIEWVDLQSSSTIPGRKKAECFRIIRSQLTNAEKTFLLYEIWDMEKRTKQVITQHRILDSLTRSDDPIIKFMLHRLKYLS
jgi:uncharacterized membrane protein